MRKLIIPLPDLQHTEKTYLDADYSSGTTLTVVNNYGFANDDFVIVGEPGEEKTETKDVTSQTGNTTINISAALKFTHNKGCVIYRYEYDQYEIYRYRSATWTLISTSNIQWDKRETIYIDTGGLSTDSYKYRLKNSAATTYSDYSPTIAATGFTRSQVGYMLREVRKIAGDEDRKIVTDDELIRQFNRAQEIIQSIRSDWWFLLVDTYKAGSGISLTAATDTYSLATYSTLNFISTVRYNFNNGSDNLTWHLKQEPKLALEYEKRDEDATDDDYLEKYTLLPPDSSSDQGYIRVWPTPEHTTGSSPQYGKLYPDYYKKMTDLDDVADETDVPIPSILEDFALAYVFAIKGDETKKKIYEERFYGPQPSKMEGAYNRTPTGIRLLELMQTNKNKALGQPKTLKSFRGRKAMKRFFQDYAVDRDELHTRYF